MVSKEDLMKDYFLICVKTLDGATARDVMLRAGVDPDHIIESGSNTWEALETSVAVEIIDLHYDGYAVHGLGIEGEACTGCDDLVCKNIDGRWRENPQKTVTETVAGLFEEKLRVTEIVAAAYSKSNEAALKLIQSFDISTGDKFALYHKAAVKEAELTYLEPEMARSAIEAEDKRALDYFSE